MPGGKAEDRGEAYWRSNYASAVQEVADKQSETAAHEARFSALAALIADPDGDRRQKAMALYEPENLTAVRHVRSIDRMRFEGLRFDVKHGRYVKLEDWEKTLGQLERQGAGAEPTGPQITYCGGW
ncbi:MAG: hypothetical protein R3F62_06950 [Planctomycetota bacterium]